MGFVPIIDSYESWYGGEWTSRKEVVGWATGASLTVRVKTIGRKAKGRVGNFRGAEAGTIGAHGHEQQWTSYHAPGALEGRDDITSVNFLPQEGHDEPELLIVGRASGELARISLSPGSSEGQIVNTYQTGGRPVRSATTSGQPFLAACLSDSAVALYSLSDDNPEVTPTAEVSVARGRTWSSRFLGNDRLAVGYGAAMQPLVVYKIDRGELITEKLLTIGFNSPNANARLDTESATDSNMTSIYSIAPVWASALGGAVEGNVFLSGAYDGLARLHDLRCPETTVAVFRDPVDTFSPIYSLLPFGNERFIAGGGRHSIIKIFDLRLPGGKLYHATDLDPCSTARHRLPKRLNSKQRYGFCNYHYEARYSRRDWNVFLNLGNRRQRSSDSPVYSLSRPSQCSPSFFAGIESTILQLDMVSIMDEHPDPIFKDRPAALANTSSTNDHVHDSIEGRWNPNRDAASLPMYEHDEGPVNLMRQQDVGRVEGLIEGWDERWSSRRSHR